MWIVRILFFVFIVIIVYIFYIILQVNHFVMDKMTTVINPIIFVSGILAFLAIRAIRKDEKLVRSADRLR